jgi:hypothetical protein
MKRTIRRLKGCATKLSYIDDARAACGTWAAAGNCGDHGSILGPTAEHGPGRRRRTWAAAAAHLGNGGARTLAAAE